MKSQIDDVKQKIDIVDYVGQFVALKKAGRNFKGLCPFHQEKSPSFVVSPDRQIWHCFGTCGEGGDVIGFLMKWENLEFFEALKELAEIAGVKLENSSIDDLAWKRKEKLYAINILASKFYQYLLHETEFGKKAKRYLLNRGLSEKIIKTFELGYAPSSWDSLYKFLLKKNYLQTEIAATGLIIDGTGKAYDRFRNRIMFPLKDSRGNIAGFSGRLLNKDSRSAKYVNTPETEIYHKRDLLYGLNLTKDAIRKADNAIIVEGEFDLISPYQHGIDNIVAIKGSALTQEQLSVIKRFTKKVTLALDTDPAGAEAMKRGIEVAEKMDFDIHVVEFSSGKDPDEAVLNNKVQFIKDVNSAVPIYDFLMKAARRKYPEDSSIDKKKIADELIPFFRLISNPIVKSHYIRQLSAMLDVQEKSVEAMLYRQDKKIRSRYKKEEPKKNGSPRPLLIQKYVLSYILQHKNPVDLAKSLSEILTQESFSVLSYGLVFEEFERYVKKIKIPYEYTKFSRILSSELVSVADELYMQSSDMPDFEETKILKLAYEIEMNNLKNKINQMLNSTESSDSKLAEFSEKLKTMEKRYQSV